MTSIHFGAWLTDGWFVEKMGRGRPNPITTSLEEAARYEQDRSRRHADPFIDRAVHARSVLSQARRVRSAALVEVHTDVCVRGLGILKTLFTLVIGDSVLDIGHS